MTSESWVLEGFGDESVEVSDRANLNVVLDRWHDEVADDPRIVTLVAPGGSEPGSIRALSVAVGAAETVLDWIDENEPMAPYLTSLGPKEDDGSQVVFKLSNTFSYFDPSVLLPMDEARAAVVEFYETGARPASVRWQSLPEGYEYVDGRYLQRDGTEPPPRPSPQAQPKLSGAERFAADLRKARHSQGAWVPVDGKWTVYWTVDWDQDIFENTTVSNAAELDTLLDRIDVLRREEFRPGMAEVVSPNGNILGVGLGRSESVLHWIPAGGELGDDLTGVGAEDSPEKWFTVEAPETEPNVQFPYSASIPMADARTAVKQFFETGALPDGIRWRAL